MKWFADATGRTLLEAEKQLLKAWLPKVLGYHLLALSDTLSADDLRASKTPLCTVGSEHLSTERAQIRLQASDLPFAHHSIDCLVLHHQLEFLKEPLLALREAERVLVSHGQFIIFGFNPHSIFGAWRHFQRKKPHRLYEHFYSLRELNYLLSETEFSIEAVQHLFYGLPSRNPPTLKKWRFLERLGPLLWPTGGAVYALRLRKDSPCLTSLPTPCQAQFAPS